MKKFALLVVALALFFGPVASKASAAAYELKIQTSLATSSMYFKTLERLKANIEKLSAGQIKVELYADGAIVKNFEIFDAVSDGLVNGGMCWTHWASGKHPAGTLFSAPIGGLGYGLDQMSQLSWMFEGEGLKLLNAYYQDILKLDMISFPVLPMGPECFGWFHEKYTSVTQINKLTFRAPPGVPSEAFKEMGMPVVSMAGGDIIPAAQRGAIQAAEWIAPGEDIVMGFPEVWKHYYLQGLHQAISIGDVYINKTWFEKLPKNLQEVINLSMKVCLIDQLLSGIKVNSEALETMVRKQGVVIEETPADYYPAFMKAARKVIAKYDKDPFFKEVHDSQIAWARLTVPFETRSNGLFYMMGKTAMEEGIITDYK